MPERVQRPASGRVLLARLAEQVIAGQDAVSATAGRGERWSTADGDQLIDGVVVAATGRRLDVELHVVAEWPPEPLQQLAARLRGGLERSASYSRLSDQLGDVDVAIHDVRERGDTGAVR